MALDLLAPLGAETRLRDNYVHQLMQTINAYLPAYIFVGEAMQNALDAVREAGGGISRINIDLDFDQRRVTVRDTGKGFPDEPSLLFLGGGTKIGQKLAGMVGVGLKVILFSSSDFRIRARNSNKRIRLDLGEACRFWESIPPTIELPDPNSLPTDPDVNYFNTGTGTEISYQFPIDDNGIPERFLRDVYEDCIVGLSPNFDESLADAAARGGYPNRLSALLASYLKRFTYLGTTQQHGEFDNLTIMVSITGSLESLGPLAIYADGHQSVIFEVKPDYLRVAETLSWAKAPKPVIQTNPLGDGGTNLTKTKLGFNVTTYSSLEGFESLLTNARGKPSSEMERFRKLLFPKLNNVTLTIGRIPQFNRYLPGGARRVISARGVITQHDIDVSSGQNQQYVRCFDLIADVDADLNYGKTMLTDMHLVANVRRFVNEAYRAVIQNAARNFVGNLKTSEPTEALFWSRESLGIEALAEKKVPHDENDVIALFFELTGRGHFGEFRWYGLSSHDTYDGRAIIRRPSDPSRLDTEPRDTDLRIIEFKLRGASIARDFDRETKHPDRVDLVICYEIGESPVDLYQVVELADSKLGLSDAEPYPGVTHVLLDTVTEREVQLLPLRSSLASIYAADTPASIPPDIADED